MRLNIKKILLVLTLIIGLLVVDYVVLLPINIRYINVLVLGIVLVIVLYIIIKYKEFNAHEFIFKNYQKSIIKNEYKRDIIVVFSLFMLIPFVIVIFTIFSSRLLYSKDYKNLIGDVKIEEFTKDFEAIQLDTLPIIDYDSASILGDKKLGSDIGLGSEFHVGEFSDIIVNGKYYSVAPLEYNGFIKYMSNKSTPGYVMVDKTNGKVDLVTSINGKKLELKYLPSAYFSKDLFRRAYFNGDMAKNFYEYNFELDDELNPYFVITKTNKTIGISGGEDVCGVIVVNAVTGEVKNYNLDNIPGWVDNVYPTDLVVNQINYWGTLNKGYFNSIFSQKEVIKATPGVRTINNNGELFHYTGLTSIGGDESTVGFIFVSAKTKNSTLYKIAGSTEQKAMESAEGRVQHLRYKATFPIPINLDGIPTFFITLKDDGGLIKQYAFVNIEDFQIVGNGDTLGQAKESYIKQLNKENIFDNTIEQKEYTGKITRIGLDINDSNLTYYFMIDTSDLLFTSTNISKEVPITVVGDKVTFSASNNKVTKFDNLTVNTK